MLAYIVVSYLDEGLKEDFEAIVRFCSIGRVKVTVNLLDCKLIKHLLSVNEVSILDVEVDIAKG